MAEGRTLPLRDCGIVSMTRTAFQTVLAVAGRRQFSVE